MSAVEVAVGGIARRAAELLLVRRARGPGRERWSIPGGRVRFGEDLRSAVVREVAEETGLAVAVGAFLGWVERIDPEADPPYHFVILDFLVTPRHPASAPRPGNDASAAAWVPVAELGALPLVDGLLEFLAGTGVLAVQPPLP